MAVVLFFFFSFFHHRSGGTPRISSGAFWVTCPCYGAYILLSEGKTSSFASKTELPYFSQTHRERKEKERGRGGNGRDAFICRLPLKWTVSITTEEHMLYIKLSSEYKSSRERPVSRVLQKDWSQSTECSKGQSRRYVENDIWLVIFKAGITNWVLHLWSGPQYPNIIPPWMSNYGQESTTGWRLVTDKHNSIFRGFCCNNIWNTNVAVAVSLLHNWSICLQLGLVVSTGDSNDGWHHQSVGPVGSPL